MTDADILHHLPILPQACVDLWEGGEQVQARPVNEDTK
jgi:hypothetical protein